MERSPIHHRCVPHEANYFAVGMVGEDQVADFAERKGKTLEEAERLLPQVLSY